MRLKQLHFLLIYVYQETISFKKIIKICLEALKTEI